MTICFNAIREAIEARYRHELATISKANRQTVGSIVLSVLQTDFRSVHQIMDLTGLTKRQVRGVINSERVRSRIKKRRRMGVTEYHCPLFEQTRPKQAELFSDRP